LPGTLDTRAAAALFILVTATHGFFGIITSFDSRWVMPTSLSILYEGNLDLDEYKSKLEELNYFATICLMEDGTFTYLPEQPRDVQRDCRGHYHHFYPLAVPALSAPLVWGAEVFFDATRPGPGPDGMTVSTGAPAHPAAAGGIPAQRIFEVERFTASVFVAFAAVFVYFFCREDLPAPWSIGLALVFAFASSAWSTGSRALWQHTLSMPLLAATLWLLSAARRRPELAAWAGLPLMTAFWVRPTNVVSLAIFSLYVVLFHRGRIAAFIAAMVPPALLFGAITFSNYGSPMAPYANASRAARQLKLHSEFWPAVAGNLWSPARGLFVYMPFVLLFPLAKRAEPPNSPRTALHWAALAVIPIHTFLVSGYVDWWGGHCFGPRYFTDLCPLFVFLLIPVVERIRTGSRLLALVFLVLAGYSGFVHWRGATSHPVLDWNAQPVLIQHAPWRIWDWTDLPFLRSGRG
jgi:hypothetical protein